MNKRRIPWIDWAKFICMYLVVVGHIANNELYLDKVLYYFHMPMFFFISGFLFKKEMKFKKLIKTRTKSLLLPYITINLLVFIFMIPEYIIKGVNIKFLLYAIATADARHEGGATWFLICLFITEIIAYFILKCKTQISLIATVIFAILATSPYVPKEMHLKLDVAFMAIPFFICGFLSKKFQIFDNIKTNKLQIFILIVVCLIIPLINGRTNMYLRNMGNYPYLYYFFTFIFIFTVQQLLSKINVPPSCITNISNGTIIYIGLQGVGIAYWNKILFRLGAFNIFHAEGYINSIFGSIVIMIAIYPLMSILLSKYPHFFGRKRKTQPKLP